MKRSTLKTGIALVCANSLLLAVCRAGDDAGKGTTPPKAVAAVSATTAKPTSSPQTTLMPASQGTGATVLTGSYLPQKVKTAGRITDGANNVTVIDRKTIEHSGARSVADLLAREPGIRIRGR